MPVDLTTSTSVSCDNQSCPGIPADLSPVELAGWIIVTCEIYGETSETHVFCSYSCGSHVFEGK